MVSELPAATRGLLVIAGLTVAGVLLILGGLTCIGAAWCAIGVGEDELVDRAIR